MLANNAATSGTKEAKELEAEDEAPEVEDGDDDDDEVDAGVEGAVPENVVILTFIPWSQWPNVPQAK